MSVETSKQPENYSSQLNTKVAIGKRKGEGYGPALSLQDVFSDSGSASGSSQKTSRLSKSGQDKGTQLEGKVNRKHPGGRRKLEQNQKRAIKLQMHVTEKEYEQLKEQFKASGIRYFSDYLRILILDERKSVSIINIKVLLKQLDRIGVQINRIGNNINQLAKYANIQLKTGKIDQRTLNKFNDQMEQYLKVQQNLVKAYRALVRNKA